MNLIQHPELLDKLAAAHALGTLRGGARRRFEAMAREQAPVRAAALVWQSRVASMNELQTAQQPAPAVWTRIENLVQGESQQQAMAAARAQAVKPQPTGWLRSLALWRGATAAGALATVFALVTAVGLRDDLGAQIGALQAQLSDQPQIEYVAVLNDEQASASMLVTFDPKNGRLTLQRVGGYQEAADKSLQLWALPPGAAPRSLGVLSQERLLQLAAELREWDAPQAKTWAAALKPLEHAAAAR
ncbi:anti-sigma factor domain-containing protein, partial [Hydrogenophaga sp.]|uniref:anti-sigma factor n=1 Tax=Hydrogenophaga sp. TaxID=1904254 RepID=UPI0027323406